MLELSKVKELLKEFNLGREDELATRGYIRREYQKKHEVPSKQEIEDFMNRRKDRLKNRFISDLLLSMKTNGTEENYKLICRELQISYPRIRELEKKGYLKKDSILYTWFYYDKENKSGEKLVSLKKLKEVTSDGFLNDKSDIIDWVVGHQIGKKGALHQLFDMERNYFVGFIRNKLTKFQISYQRHIVDELINECYIFFYQLVDRIVLRENAKIATYIRKRMRGYIHNYIKKNYANKQEIPSYDKVSNTSVGVFNYYETPLELLIKKQQREVMQIAYSHMKIEEMQILHDLYFSEKSFLSIWDILDTDIDGEYIHSAVEIFQKEYSKLYEGARE